MSSSAPHLYRDRVDDFAAEVRELLAARSPDGLFWDWPGDTENVLARKCQRAGCKPALHPKPLDGSLHHPAHVRHAGAGADGVLLRGLGDDRLGGEDVLGDRRCVLQRRARDHGRVSDPALEQVLDLAGLDVEAEALLGTPYLLDDDGALETRVVRELAERLLERADDDLRARLRVPLELAESVVADSFRGVDERDAAARNLALLESRAGSLQRVLDAVLLLLHLGLVRTAALAPGAAAGQLGEPLLELLAVEVGV